MNGQAGATTAIVKRSVAIAGHRTSISLEPAFWLRLRDIAAQRQMSVAALVAEVDAQRAGVNLSSAIRVFVLEEALAARSVPVAGGFPSPGKPP